MCHPVKETGVPLYAVRLEQYGEVKDIPPSSIIRLLGTNSAPLDDQRDQVRGLLAEPKAELEAVEEDIFRLQARLADIQRRKHELTSYVEDLGALLSPIRRMPPEIMARVFDFCGDIYVRGPHCEPSRHAPLLLGSVCRSWRTLSLAMPRLWTALYLDLPTFGTLNKQEEVLYAWIHRSRPFPISLWLWNDFLTDDVPATFLRRLSHIIEENADRWRAIFVHFPAATRDWDCFNALLCCHLPVLEELEISPQCTPWAPFRPELLPRLRELQIPAGAMPDSHSTLPWTQLTQLTLRGGYRPADIDVLLGILTYAPHLAHLHVEITQYKCETKWDDTQERIAMPCLATLVLVTISSHDECLTHFMDALSMPVLRDFQLLTRVWDTSNMTTRWCHDSFLGLLARSKCALNHFTLAAVDMSSGELRQVLERCPSLVLLKLNGMEVPSLIGPLLKDMMDTSDYERNVPLAPWLKAISLSCESMDALDHQIDDTGLTFEQAFTQLVTSRTTKRDPSSKALQLKWIHWTIWWSWCRYQPPVQAHPHPELERRLSMLCADEVDVGVSSAMYNKYKRVS
ncbi:hypothetical protein JVT61DRAFT_4458 [Boletus reticuloceps]|uniref:F-box domain-containing protein n=1 Tax=Boletus reticuloceps TaxID=495285 RepID=A0A8I3A928_9AGAM|nr:hypothetical protein JVT61DRAFT_4458 [Boletus reticuloceps]